MCTKRTLFSDIQILTMQDVAEFTKYLVHDLSVNIHPDTPFDEYINLRTGDKSFSDNDIVIGNRLMEQCFDVCSKNKIDIYDFMNEILTSY